MQSTLAPIPKDLVAASATPLVLSILLKGESYGYAIIARVKELSHGHLEWTDGMLYPILHRLEEQGLIRATWRNAENGRRRRYYAISSAGKKALTEQRAQWNLVSSVLESAQEMARV